MMETIDELLFVANGVFSSLEIYDLLGFFRERAEEVFCHFDPLLLMIR